jgi:hypothetical protein
MSDIHKNQAVVFYDKIKLPDSQLCIMLEVNPDTPMVGIRQQDEGSGMYTVRSVDSAGRSTYLIKANTFRYGGYTTEDFIEEFFKEANVNKHIRDALIKEKGAMVQ